MQPAPVTKILPHLSVLQTQFGGTEIHLAGILFRGRNNSGFLPLRSERHAAETRSWWARLRPVTGISLIGPTADARVALSPQPLAEIKLSGGFFLTVRD